MELNEFVKKSLIEINEGINEAKEEGVNLETGYSKTIKFDISVTVDNSEENRMGGGIFVAGIGLGAKTADKSNTGTTSRIKFKVTMFYGNKDDSKEPSISTY